jgi:hypothetical protein
MREGMQGLAMLVQEHLKRDPDAGDLLERLNGKRRFKPPPAGWAVAAFSGPLDFAVALALVLGNASSLTRGIAPAQSAR